MLRVKRFKLKEGCEPPARAYCNLGYDVSLLQDWGKNHNIDPESDTWDLDWFIVLDEEFCQPYTPFYDHIDDNIDAVGNEALVSIVQAYNKYMSCLDWLEEK